MSMFGLVLGIVTLFLLKRNCLADINNLGHIQNLEI